MRCSQSVRSGFVGLADRTGNLCTLVLVALLDFMLGAGLPTVPTLIGGALIIGAFVSLALDSLRS